jgi:hypothetical protein
MKGKKEQRKKGFNFFKNFQQINKASQKMAKEKYKEVACTMLGM